MNNTKNVRCIEVLGLAACLLAYLQGDAVFYGRQTMLFRLLAKYFPKAMLNNCRWLSYGELNQVPEIRSNAYGLAKQRIAALRLRDWNLRPLAILGAANDLIVEKLLMQQLFDKYEFYGLVAQYSSEHPETRVCVSVDALHYQTQLLPQGPHCVIRKQWVFHRVQFLFSIPIMAAYVFYFNRRNCGDKLPARKFENAILCEIDSPVVQGMFCELLEGYRDIHFLTRKNYPCGIRQQFVDWTVYEMDAEKQDLLWQATKVLIANSLSVEAGLFRYGTLLFQLVRIYAHGILITPSARNCSYLTFEHLSVERAVRNEILKIHGNRSVFVPYNIYTSSPYYAPEYKINYDVLCSPGILCERSYVLQKASTQVVLPTGSYHANKRAATLGDAQARQASLREFIGTSICITILCNGVEDVTLSGEVRLMKLARELAGQNGIKILVRQKPVQPEQQYRNFYLDMTAEHPDILLTHKEYDLYDFLEVSDLFVTSNSSSILEFCAAGKPIFAVNFWNRNDMFNWQTAVEGVYLDTAEALVTIMDWCHNPNKRSQHSHRMAELSQLISYSFSDFSAFKLNFRKLLNPYLPNSTHPHPASSTG